MRIIMHLMEDKKFLHAAILKFSIDPLVKNIFFSIGKAHFKRYGSTLILSLPTVILNLLIPFSHIFVKALVIHGFSNSFFNLNFNKLHHNVKIMGIFWGFDLYSLNSSRNDYLLSETQKLDKKISPFNQKLSSKGFMDFLENRLDFVSTIVPEEFEILKFHLPNAKFKFSWFSYFDLENDVLKGAQVKGIPISGNNLIFGNNSSLWNNHLDGIEIINSFKFDFGKIICPLSYSGSEDYKNTVIERFTKEFQDKFEPLTRFMAYDEYLKSLASCRFVFFHSKRQIGLGNLLYSIYLGSVIILDKENPLYRFFLSNEIKVFSIEEAKENVEFSFDIRKSRENLKRIFGEDALKKRTFPVIQNLISA